MFSSNDSCVIVIVYIFLIFVSTVIFISHIYVKSEKVNKITAFLWVIMMTLFVGSQDGIGNDHANYIAQIKSPWATPQEPFTLFIFYIIRSCDLSVYVFFYIYAFLTYYFLYKVILLSDKSIRFIIVMMILQSLLFFQSFNLIRQILACAIFLYGISLILNNKKGYWFLLLACLVHYSAFFGLLIVWIASKIRVSTVMLIVYIMSVALLYTGGFIGDFISKYEFLIRMTYYGYYLDSSLINDDVAANFGVVYKITFILCLVVYTKRKFFKSNGQILLFNLFFVGQILYNLSSANITIQRATYFPYFSMILVIPLLAKCFSPYWNSRLALVLYSLYFLFISASLASQDCPYVPYKNIIWN
nr:MULTISPECIES: EpsG family protein [Bacteroides]